jgi:hypothetical protein
MNPVRLRSVALPSEHGGRGLVLEPPALGLLLAPSVSGLFLSVALIGVFLAHHPLQVVWRDARKGKRYPRTFVGVAFLVLYGALAGLGAVLAFERSGAGAFAPLLAALPLGVAFVGATAGGSMRAVWVEVLGSATFAAGAAAVAAAGGAPKTLAWTLWAVAAARSVPAVLYVRARLRLERGERPPRTPALGAHLAGVGVVTTGALEGPVPELAIPASALLFLRAAWGLSRWRRSATARQVGIAELGWGALYVLLIGLGGL